MELLDKAIKRGTLQTRERRSVLPASTFLSTSSPKKDTRIDSNLAVVLYLFCKNMLHALEGVQNTKLAKGLESVTSDRESGR